MAQKNRQYEETQGGKGYEYEEGEPKRDEAYEYEEGHPNYGQGYKKERPKEQGRQARTLLSFGLLFAMLVASAFAMESTCTFAATATFTDFKTLANFDTVTDHGLFANFETARPSTDSQTFEDRTTFGVFNSMDRDRVFTAATTFDNGKNWALAVGFNAVTEFVAEEQFCERFSVDASHAVALSPKILTSSGRDASFEVKFSGSKKTFEPSSFGALSIAAFTTSDTTSSFATEFLLGASQKQNDFEFDKFTSNTFKFEKSKKALPIT